MALDTSKFTPPPQCTIIGVVTMPDLNLNIMQVTLSLLEPVQASAARVKGVKGLGLFVALFITDSLHCCYGWGTEGVALFYSAFLFSKSTFCLTMSL